MPSQYRLVGPKPWAGAREAILGAEDRIVYAISGGKHLRDIKKNKYAPWALGMACWHIAPGRGWREGLVYVPCRGRGWRTW